MGFKDQLREASAAGAAKLKEAAKEKLDERNARQSAPASATTDPSRPLFVGQSHDEGRNATVTLWPDRLERVQSKKMTSLSRAAQDVEVTPVRAISSVQAKKDGMRFSIVTVYASGNNIVFKLGHDEAARFKNALTSLILAPTAPVAPVTAAPDLAEQLRKLGELRDSGVLTEDEFQAKKAELLARL